MRVRSLAAPAVALLLSALLVTEPAPQASAARSKHQRDVQSQLDTLRQAVGEASQQEAQLLGDLADTRDRIGRFDGVIRKLEGDLAAASQKVGKAQAEVDRLDAQFVALTRRLEDAQQQYDSTRGVLGNLAARLYRQQAGGAQAAALYTLTLRSGTPHDLFAAQQYLADAAGQRRTQMDQLNVLKADITDTRQQLDAQRQAAQVARDLVARERAKVADLKAQQEQARAQVVAEQQREQQDLAQIRARKDEFEAQIAQLQADSSRFGDLLRSRQSGQVLRPSGKGVLGIPVEAPITSGFGMRYHPILGTYRMHTGIDLGAGYGTPIRAAGSGVVVTAGWCGGYGNCVIIDHGDALATMYAHQASLAVSEGQTVNRGQVIGYVGSSGMSTGPHLHFEVRARGTPVDPLGYL